MRWRQQTSTKDKFFRSSRKVFSKKAYILFLSYYGTLPLVGWFLATILSCFVIRTLLFRAGVELNPGPVDVEGFCLRSQNCRGLTDRNKLFKLLRKMFPISRAGLTAKSIVCLQETHQVDKFVLNYHFKGTAVVDDGERNQRGVCTLVSEDFEVCSSNISNIGRWVIVVVRSRNDSFPQKYVVVNLYAPNSHREAEGFYQDLFQALDEVTESLSQLGEDYSIAVAGDFNVVLDQVNGASNRIGSRAERDLARIITASMNERHLREPLPVEAGNSYTWRRGTCQSKLDYFFLSPSLLARSSPVEIRWHEFGANFDHAAIKVSFKSSIETERGRSFPKLYKSDLQSDNDRQWLADQIGQSRNQMPAHWNPHQKLDFVKMMLRSKTLELRQMRKFAGSCDSIREEINSIALTSPLSASDSLKIDSLKLRLHELEEAEAESLRIKAGVRWREEGEKSTSYFLAKFKARSEGAVMHSLNLGTRIVTGSKLILSAVKQFYKCLYNERRPEKLDDATFLDNFFAHCPRLDREQQAIMARPLELEELKEALKSCSDSAPGLDGIPYSFYKAFPDPLLTLVSESWTFALATQNLASSHKQSCITLLPKKGKDLSLVGNWRPISLSSCDLKIITKAFANRLKGILPSILCEAQAAYTPGRDINFNNRLLRYARAYAVSQRKDYCVVSLDAKKAFDSVSHEYLVKVLEVYGFPPEFVTAFCTLYGDLSSVVQVNGFLSTEFKIGNGVKQGDALSCGLFVLAIDPLLRNIYHNVHIEGLDLPIDPTEVEEIKILSYADDITILSKNEDLQDIFSEYERFSKVSGLVLNADKTEIYNFVPSRNLASRINYLDKSYVLGRVDKIKVCGMWIATDDDDDYRLNVLDKLEAMEATVMRWGRRHVTMNGRMILAKTFLLSLVVFPAQFLQIKKKEIKRIEKLIYSFVNGAKNLYGPERIARAHLKAPKDSGGIDGVDVESFIRAIATKQFIKATRSHKALRLLQFSSEIPSDGISICARAVLRQNYKKFSTAHSMPDLHQLESISGLPLALMLGPDTQAARYASRCLLDSLGALQQAFITNRNDRSMISSILRAIPQPFANLIRTQALFQVPVRIAWLSTESIMNADQMPTKVLRQALVQIKFPNLQVQIGKIYKRNDWPPPGMESVYEATLSNTWAIKNPTLRAVRLKVLYKDVFSNERRYRFGLVNSPRCDICGGLESVEHHLFSCQNARRLWALYNRLTNQGVNNLFDVLICGNNPSFEIIKSIVLKALIQIDRSKDKTEREIVSQCSFFLRIEARTNSKYRDSMLTLANSIDSRP